MGSRSRHISIGIDRPVTVVYDVAAGPLNLPKNVFGKRSAWLRDCCG
jgi:hypothetical protein